MTQEMILIARFLGKVFIHLFTNIKDTSENVKSTLSSHSLKFNANFEDPGYLKPMFRNSN